MIVPVRDDYREQSGWLLHRTHTSPTIHIPAVLVPAIPIGHRALAIVLGQRIAVDDKQVLSALPLDQIQRLVVQRDGLLRIYLMEKREQTVKTEPQHCRLKSCPLETERGRTRKENDMYMYAVDPCEYLLKILPMRSGRASVSTNLGGFPPSRQKSPFRALRFRL